MEGYEVKTVEDTLGEADIYVTATGNKEVITVEHMKKMKDQAVVSNIGHFDNEIQVEKLNKTKGVKKINIKPQVDKYIMPNGKAIYMLAEGRLVNLAMAEGHPASVMDMSFANQALGAKFILDNRGKLENKVYVIPEAVDRAIAERKLRALGVKIDTLTPAQAKYLESWEEGTS
ncbi:MAG: Adenosylhomocysteinase [Parcubacteria group bacterium GW2011_GWF2_50_9]|nr:MAG: Adenosylhomocysteinase [Parcubacteria group bacterium GW2011_GWF2_50_9]